MHNQRLKINEIKSGMVVASVENMVVVYKIISTDIKNNKIYAQPYTKMVPFEGLLSDTVYSVEADRYGNTIFVFLGKNWKEIYGQ